MNSSKTQKHKARISEPIELTISGLRYTFTFDVYLKDQVVWDPSLNIWISTVAYSSLEQQVRKLFWNTYIGIGDEGVTVWNWEVYDM